MPDEIEPVEEIQDTVPFEEEICTFDVAVSSHVDVAGGRSVAGTVGDAVDCFKGQRLDLSPC